MLCLYLLVIVLLGLSYGDDNEYGLRRYRDRFPKFRSYRYDYDDDYSGDYYPRRSSVRYGRHGHNDDYHLPRYGRYPGHRFHSEDRHYHDDDHDYHDKDHAGYKKAYKTEKHPHGYMKRYPDGYEYSYRKRQAPKETYSEEHYPYDGEYDKATYEHRRVHKPRKYDHDFDLRPRGYRNSAFPKRYEHEEYTPKHADFKYEREEKDESPAVEEKTEYKKEAVVEEEPEAKKEVKPKERRVPKKPCVGERTYCNCMANIKAAGLSEEEKSDSCKMFMTWGKHMASGNTHMIGKALDDEFNKIGDQNRLGARSYFEKDWEH